MKVRFADRNCGQKLFYLIPLLSTVLFPMSDAHALSAGCSEANAGTLNFTSLGTGATDTITKSWDAGDVLTITVTPGSANVSMTITFGSVVASSVVVNIGSPQSFTATAGSTGSIGLVLNSTILADSTYTFTCVAAGTSGASGSSEATAAQARSVLGSQQASHTKVAIGEQREMVMDRVTFMTHSRFRRDAIMNRATANAGNAGAWTEGRGAAGGDGKRQDIGAWADVSWTGYQNNKANIGSDGTSITGTAGADMQLSPELTVGAAFSAGASDVNAGAGATKSISTETRFGITPYFGYSISELVALQAALGYSHAFGDASYGGADGSFDVDRYFLAANLSAMPTWDNFALMASGGLSWSQAFQSSYSLSDGTAIDATSDSRGTASLMLEPSYLLPVFGGDGDFLETYLTGEYQYSFVATEYSGYANDKDQFTVGGGMRFYSSSDVSGSLGYEEVLGLENQVNKTVKASVRVDF